MNKKDIFLIVTPFFLASLFIFGHYRFLATQNPQAHQRPIITTNRVQTLKDSELIPIPPQAPFPNQLVGVMHEVPTSKKQLTELIELITSQQANTLFIKVGLILTADGNIIIKQAAESSEDTILRWTKKTIRDAHQAGIHTYLSLVFIEEQPISDIVKFADQLSSLVERWAAMAQEYYVTFFDPGLTLGYPVFNKIPPEQLKTLIVKMERKTREIYTGRIGIGYCCGPQTTYARGYNQIVIITRSADQQNELTKQAEFDAKSYQVEHIYLLDLDTQRLTTIL